MNLMIKKLLSVAMLLTVVSLANVQAQSFEFRYHGVAIGDEETVSIPAETDAIFGELVCETNPTSNPANGLVLVGTGDALALVSGTAHLEIMEHTFNASTIQWCMGGACVLMRDVTELDKEFEGTTVLTQFDAHNILQQGYLLAKLTATVGSQTTTIYIEFTNGQSSGISSMKVEQERADIYDLNGRLVMRQADAETRRQLPTGMYVMKSGKNVRKVMVR